MEGIISDSPEEMRLAFFKKLKQFQISHRISVWTRKENLPTGKDIYFLTQRDYVFLKKQNLLPNPSKICLLMTEQYLIDPKEEAVLWKMSAVISGNEQHRGEIAASYYQKIIEIRERKFLENMTLNEDINELKLNDFPVWLKKKITSAITELECIGPLKNGFILKDSKLIIKSSIKIKCPDWNDLTKAMTTLSFDNEDESQLIRVVLSKLIREINNIVIYPSGESETSFYFEFIKEKNQKSYESKPKLIGVIQDEYHSVDKMA